MTTDTKRRQLKRIAERISTCRQCPGMNVPGVTASAPGYGSAHAPVAIVGQSLCRKCMESGIPFTGGSGTYIDRALELAGREKPELFITNVVHCHPEDDRKSYRYEIDNCRHFLHEELDVVSPRLIIGLGEDAEKVLSERYPDARHLPWPFVKTRTRTLAERYLLFPEHPGSLRFKKTAERAYYSPSLARAIAWGFEVG
ncbi:uracil-DNA glycosylase [Mycobacteroides abscessus subsp. massiliense]|uniref:uracil-DNA glycosylase family protein n=1 Tax=Mycobacteroides abscessus TaxID=36809 RepID=UPI0009A6341B|nr:uracil-DNA glycosylase family protein [Mycobacteroides abscessus]SKE70251.1 uracil-DNA glycosylase [Mycobacteroides abscessus subsp. massiliense]SKH80809.1 uracil-DNA glycosylase [Mycobacteroides abscessus subsp. massiliense]SKI34378.1 uracil-DNA glycosylase [Mycobacteroides abscessus subsp. massiliense]SKJ36417.1 uracil-DNA glycosylase [Mycobacteroides abscessus subsp. massiliense]SKK23590.1 uracil-DNA glycosylase [Mycobacteroides abscessus subsp. massiliense]